MRAGLILLALSLAACCSAPSGQALAPEAPADPPAVQPADMPASFEDREKAKTDALRQGANTYDQTCGPLRRTLDAVPLPDSMRQRVAQSDVAKLGGAPHPPILLAGTIPLTARRTSAVCDLVFDIDETGTPRTPEVRCSDPSLETHALAALETTRFEPYTLNGKALPVSGILMPMEFCIDE